MGLQIRVKVSHRSFPIAQWLRFCVSNARGHEFDLLLEELRSHMPHGMAKKQIEWKELKTEKTNTTVSFVCEGITRTSTPTPKASFSFQEDRD